MPLYHYRVLTDNGETLEGQMEAPDSDTVILRLQKSGYYPIDTKPVSEDGSRLFGRIRKRVGREEILLMTRKLSVMLRSGLTLDDALALLREGAEAGPFREMLEQVLIAVQNGAPLSAALQQHSDSFDRFYINTLRAGEAAGTLDLVLARLASHLERMRALRKSVISALTYPAILCIVAALTLVVLLVYVVPQFQMLFEDLGQALPLPTTIVIAVAELVRDYGWLILVGLAVIGFLGRQLMRDEEGREVIDRWLLTLPLVSRITEGFEVARFSRALATLLANGVPLVSALEVVTEIVGNSIIRKRLRKVRSQVSEGRALAVALSYEAHFPQMATQLIRVGEESGELVIMLEQVADIHDEELRESIQYFLAILEPVMIIVLGVVIAGIILSVLLAILSLNDFVV